MNPQLLLKNITSLPPFAQQEVFDFVGYLKQRYAQYQVEISVKHDWDNDPVIGIWEDRDDLEDSAAYVRQLRQNAWRSKS